MKRFVVLLLLIGIIAGCSREPQTTEEFLAAGQRAFVDHDYFRARVCLNEVVRERPSDRLPLFLLGLAYFEDNMPDSAEFFLARVNMLFPKDIEIMEKLYQAQSQSGHWDEARRTMQELFLLGVPEADHLDEIFELSMNAKRFDHAYHWSRKLLQVNPDEPQRWLNTANLAAEVGSIYVAIDVIDSAIDRFGPREELLNNKGLFLVSTDDGARAEKIFRELVDLDTTKIEYRLNLANALSVQSDKKKKREAYRRYNDLADQIPNRVWIDSTLTQLAEELGLPLPVRDSSKGKP
ncbi:MAG: hypothetical protein ABIE70_00390 [bacterium]